MKDRNANRAWYTRKRIWVTLILLGGLWLFIAALPPKVPMNIVYLAKAYTEPEICEGALEIARKNPKIVELFGTLLPMVKLDMLNGSVQYSKGGDSVAITINVDGDKQQKKMHSKMDVVAFMKDENWEYQTIRVRIKQPPELRQRIAILGLQE